MSTSNGSIRTMSNEFEATTPFFASITLWLQLIKGLLCIPIALSTGFGYILYTREITGTLFFLILAMFLLACGSAALNSLQEIKNDRLYKRTENRPLVTGALSPHVVIPFIGGLFIASFSLLLTAATSLNALLLGILGVILYNGLYTPLKHQTSFSLLVGGLAGALPPVIGWCAAGGSITDYRIVAVATLFYLWQVPHFFLILLVHKKDYIRTSHPNLAVILSENTLRWITWLWIFAYASVGFTLSILPGFLSQFSRGCNGILTLLTMGLLTFYLVIRPTPSHYTRLFQVLNISFFFNITLVAAAEVFSFANAFNQ